MSSEDMLMDVDYNDDGKDSPDLGTERSLVFAKMIMLDEDSSSSGSSSGSVRDLNSRSDDEGQLRIGELSHQMEAMMSISLGAADEEEDEEGDDMQVEGQLDLLVADEPEQLPGIVYIASQLQTLAIPALDKQRESAFSFGTEEGQCFKRTLPGSYFGVQRSDGIEQARAMAHAEGCFVPLWSVQVSRSGAMQYILATEQALWNDCFLKYPPDRLNYYEYTQRGVPVKFFLDLEALKAFMSEEEFEERIGVVVRLIVSLVHEKFGIQVLEYVDLDASSDALDPPEIAKHSRHMIFNLGSCCLFKTIQDAKCFAGYVVERGRAAYPAFFTVSSKPFGILDMSPFRVGAFRCYLNTKKGQMRPLLPHGVQRQSEPNFQTFLKSLVHHFPSDKPLTLLVCKGATLTRAGPERNSVSLAKSATHSNSAFDGYLRSADGITSLPFGLLKRALDMADEGAKYLASVCKCFYYVLRGRWPYSINQSAYINVLERFVNENFVDEEHRRYTSSGKHKYFEGYYVDDVPGKCVCIGTTSRECFINRRLKGRPHLRNTVYWVFFPHNGVYYQKCFDVDCLKERNRMLLDPPREAMPPYVLEGQEIPPRVLQQLYHIEHPADVVRIYGRQGPGRVCKVSKPFCVEDGKIVPSLLIFRKGSIICFNVREKGSSVLSTKKAIITGFSVSKKLAKVKLVSTGVAQPYSVNLRHCRILGHEEQADFVFVGEGQTPATMPSALSAQASASLVMSSELPPTQTQHAQVQELVGDDQKENGDENEEEEDEEEKEEKEETKGQLVSPRAVVRAPLFRRGRSLGGLGSRKRKVSRQKPFNAPSRKVRP